MQKLVDFANTAKEYLIKYKRYIGAAVLFLVFVFVLVRCTGPKNGIGGDTQAETGSYVESTRYELKGKLEENANQDLIDLITNYYSAYASGDYDTLEGLVSPLSDNEKSYIGALSDYYEKYDNVTCYSMPGATDDSYLVSVVYDLKFYEVDTPAPGMDFFYVEKNDEGKLFINNIYSSYNFNFLEEPLDADLYALILNYEKSDDVKALQSQVQSRYEEAVTSDDKLANMVGGTLRDVISQWRSSVADTQTGNDQPATQEPDTTADASTQPDTQPADTQPADTQQDEKPKDETPKEGEPKQDTGKVKTTDICNVREKASTDSKVLGRVDIDVELEKTGTSGDWTQVTFQGGTGYIKSNLLKDVK